MRKQLFQEWSRILLSEKSSPYVFRTRLERALKHTLNYAGIESDSQMKGECTRLLDKLKYISDQSNQTSDGCLNSYKVLKDDMIRIQELLAWNLFDYEVHNNWNKKG